MTEPVTIVVVPRDRFSSAVACAEKILEHTDVPFRLVFLDFGYPEATLNQLRALCGDRIPLEIVPCGQTIPMAAFRDYVQKIQTRYTAWVDNDTFVTAGWMTALMDRAAQGARVILPVTLEREGLDVDPRKLPLRNHISHSELRRLTVDGVTYVFDHKPYRRAAPEDLPREAHTVDFFELHAFFAETDVLRQLDLPDMVVREHIDIGIQLHQKGIEIWCEPKAVVHFDNIHERPSWGDLKFFFYRWSEGLVNQSHELFEKRWGYRFYNEQFLKNWAFRRKVFSLCRFAGVPNKLADVASRGFNKLLRPPLPVRNVKDPVAESERALEKRELAAQVG